MATRRSKPWRLVDADQVVLFEHQRLLDLQSGETASDADPFKKVARNAQAKRGSLNRDTLNKRILHVDERVAAGKLPADADSKQKFDWRDGQRQLAQNSEETIKTATGAEEPEGNVQPPGKHAPTTTGYLSGGVFPTVGLALSGGGIRSAAVCTGAMQGLAGHRIDEHHSAFDLVDYLSTVSGGGYIGSTVSLNVAAGNGFVLLDPTGEKKDTEALKTVRNNSNYLKFGQLVPTIQNIGIYLRGFMVNIFMFGFLLLLLATLTLFANNSYASLTTADFFGFPIDSRFLFTKALPITALIALAFALWNLGWANILCILSPERAGLRSSLLWISVIALPIILASFWLELQPLVVHKMVGDPAFKEVVSSCPNAELLVSCNNAEGQALPAGQACPKERLQFSCKKPTEVPPETAANLGNALSRVVDWMKYLLAPFVAFVTVFSRNIGDYFKQEEVQTGWKAFVGRNLSRIIVWGAAIAFFLILWIVFLTLVYWGIDTSGIKGFLPDQNVPPSVLSVFEWWRSHAPSQIRGIGYLYLFSGLALCALTSGLAPNANSLHRLYRDRLGDAFCFVQNGKASKVVDREKLSRWQRKRPIHLINAAINLQQSKKVKEKGRKADFFVFTPYRIGSVATGYAQTRVMESLKHGKDIDIATAIAISGAAVSSNMGSESMSPLAPLLAFLNLRLGHWFPNPKQVERKANLRPSLWYLFFEATGNLNERRDAVYLTDGGHIENLGVFELLRRRCRLIIAIDGEADPKLSFPAFVKLQRYARIDLGARIDMSWSQITAVSSAAMSGKGEAKKGPHCAIGRIEYDNGGMGILIYVKSSVTGDENDYVREYNRRNAAFPHETTSDQFFNEEQFEVYRALGFHIVRNMLSGEDFVETSAGLERLNDRAAKGDCVQEVAMLLGIEQKDYPVVAVQPVIHKVELV